MNTHSGAIYLLTDLTKCAHGLKKRGKVVIRTGVSWGDNPLGTGRGVTAKHEGGGEAPKTRIGDEAFPGQF